MQIDDSIDSSHGINPKTKPMKRLPSFVYSVPSMHAHVFSHHSYPHLCSSWSSLSQLKWKSIAFVHVPDDCHPAPADSAKKLIALSRL